MSMGFSRQEYWSGLPFPPPGDLPDPGIEPTSLALAGGFFAIEPPGKSSVVKEINIKNRSEMTFILKQAENKEQLHGELLGEDGRTKKSSATRQSEKKKIHQNKIHQQQLPCARSAGKGSQEKGRRFQFGTKMCAS